MRLNNSSLEVYGGGNFYDNFYCQKNLSVLGTVYFQNPLNMSYVGNGDVTNTQLSYLNTLTSNVQTQINNKQDILSATNLLNCLYVGNGDISISVLSYIKNLSSYTQTQLNDKQSLLFLSNKLDPSFINNSTGLLSSTIMGYLVNISSDVQTQFTNKQDKIFNNISNVITSASNYNFDFRRTDTGTDPILYLGSQATGTTRVAKLYFSDVSNANGLEIQHVCAGKTTNINHNATGNWAFNLIQFNQVIYIFNMLLLPI